MKRTGWSHEANNKLQTFHCSNIYYAGRVFWSIQFTAIQDIANAYGRTIIILTEEGEGWRELHANMLRVWEEEQKA